MNVVHIIESGGGSSLFVFYLAKYQPNNFHFIVAGIRAMEYFKKLETENDFPQNIKLIEWKVEREINLINDFISLFELNKILKKINYDLIHAHSSKAGFLSRFLFLFQPRKKLLYCPHGAPFFRKDVIFFKRYLYTTLEYIAAFFCGKVLACSKSEAIEYIKIGINADYINNGTEVPFFENSLSINSPLDSKDFVIVSIGRITFQKNPKLFNEIAKLFINDKNIKFIWIGDGELKGEIDSPNVTITGWMSKLEISKLLIDVDLYISTSLWEGLPLSVLEAMCFSKPLLLYPCVGNVDVLKEEYNGYEFNDPLTAYSLINFLKNNFQKKLEMGKNSRILVENDFNIVTQVAKYEEYYVKFYNS